MHFTSAHNTCDIKILILLYTAEKRTFFGFIPNEQAAFVDRLRKLIQHQKQGNRQVCFSMAPPDMLSRLMMIFWLLSFFFQLFLVCISVGKVNLLPFFGLLQVGAQQVQGQNQTQQGMLISQTNQMAMVGGQITQNIVSSTTGGPGVQVQGLGQQGTNPGAVGGAGPSGPMAAGMTGAQNPMGMQVLLFSCCCLHG